MSGKDCEIGSDLLLKQGVDKLSDEIITHILLFLPLEEAVATSILSSRWSNSWKYTPNLNFDECDECYECYDSEIDIPEDKRLELSLKNAKKVNSVLNSYESPSLKQFTIDFYVHRKTFDQVSKWLRFAFSRRVESLELDFWDAPSVLDNDILSGIQSSDCRFLRELTLVGLKVSGEAIEFLLSNCSVLERLIMDVTLTSDVVIGGTLKYLEIHPEEEIDGGFIKVVRAPNLTRLLIFDNNLKKLLLENVHNLVEASFPLSRDETMLQYFSKSASKLEILTISLLQPRAFAVPQMPNLKKLVVNYASVNRKYLLPITCVLEASPRLEEFKLEIGYKYFYYMPSISEPMFKVPEHGGFRHKHLKVFELVGFCDKADYVELVRYIGNNCVGLEKIAITPMSTSLAHRLAHRHLSEEVDVVAEEREKLNMKKSTEEVLAGILPDGIKLLVNSQLSNYSISHSYNQIYGMYY